MSGSGAGRRSVLSTSEGQNRGAFTARDWGLFASIGGIWGASFLFIAVGLEAFEPGVITWARVVLGAAVLWLLPASRTPIPRHERPRLVAVSVLWVAIPFTLFPLAEQHITSALTGLLNGAVPIMTAAIGAIMLRRLPDRSHLTGLAIGFVGVAIIALPAAGSGSSQAIGVAMVLAAITCYGCAANIAVPLTQRHGSLPVMARMLTVAAVLTAPLGLAGLPASSVRVASLAAVAVLGVVGTGLAFWIMGRLIARVGATRAAFAIYLTPVVALILGVVFLDERVHAGAIVGVALVIGGAILASRKETTS
ncbi:MAG TPA: DMT family transporter [Actinomycetota bacterium]|jgi:drug/metabolite transporter (DMT)-like permease